MSAEAEVKKAQPKKRAPATSAPKASLVADSLPEDPQAALRVVADAIDEIRVSVNLFTEDVMGKLHEISENQRAVNMLAGKRESTKHDPTAEQFMRHTAWMVEAFGIFSRLISMADPQTQGRFRLMLRVMERHLERQEARIAKKKPEKPIHAWTKYALLVLIAVLAIIGLFVTTGWVFG